MINRHNIINHFIHTRGFTTYLELGVYDKETTYNHIVCQTKKCVDMNFDADYIMDTDTFFEKYDGDKFDIIFIDANHTEPFLTRDIHNSLKILSDGGVIICHDVNPPSEYHQIDENNLYQTAWRSFVKFRFSTNFFTYSYPQDCGIGVIDTSQVFPKKPETHVDLENLTYSDLEANRKHLLGAWN